MHYIVNFDSCWITHKFKMQNSVNFAMPKPQDSGHDCHNIPLHHPKKSLKADGNKRKILILKRYEYALWLAHKRIHQCKHEKESVGGGGGGNGSWGKREKEVAKNGKKLRFIKKKKFNWELSKFTLYTKIWDRVGVLPSEWMGLNAYLTGCQLAIAPSFEILLLTNHQVPPETSAIKMNGLYSHNCKHVLCMEQVWKCLTLSWIIGSNV